MHQFFKIPCLLLLTVFVGLSAKADPVEVTNQTLARNASSGLVLQTQLQKNITRSEAYQAEYTEQVPYQSTETYYESVPYQTQEAYTDYERQCHFERRCYAAVEAVTIDNSDSFFSNFGGGVGDPKDCAVNPAACGGRGPGGPPPGGGFPGRGDHGGGRGWPGHGGGGGGFPPGDGHGPGPRPPQCHEEQVCNVVPVTRYRTVTRYRDEARTRTVTRYRTETRCCVTKYHDVFDHQWTTQVAIQFPQGTELANNEQETFRIALAGSEGAADATLSPLTTVFGYQVASKQASGNLVTFILAQTPRYRAADLMQSSLQNINVNAVSAGVVFSFQDNAAQYPRVSSSYQVVVAEASTHQQVASSETIAGGQRQVSASLAFPWDATKLYEVTINVHREGSVIDTGVVDFQVTQVISLAVDQGALKDDNKIAGVRIVGAANQAILSFTDLTLPYAGVVTDYTITLVRNGTSLVAKSYSRAALQAAADGSVALSLLDFGMSAANLNLIQPGASLKVVVEVRRAQTKFAKIQFWKDTSIVVQ